MIPSQSQASTLLECFGESDTSEHVQEKRCLSLSWLQCTESFHIEMTASLLHVCFLNRTRKQERKTCSVYILIAQVQGRIKTYRGGGRKSDGLRCGGGGGELEGVGRQQRSTGGRQMSRQNHSTNITTTFLTQHKTKTATTIKISRQHLKISGNKTCERSSKSLPTPTAKVCDRHSKSLRTPTTQVCERHCQSLTRCYGSRKISHVFTSTLSLLPRGVIFKLSTKILTEILLINHAAGASRMSLPRCRFHICRTGTEQQNIDPLSIDAQKAHLYYN